MTCSFSNSGVPTIVTGPSWSAGTAGSITAGSCARGTGAGGTALSRVSGIYTNAVQITGRNGSTTYTIAANLATYLGSSSWTAPTGTVNATAMTATIGIGINSTSAYTGTTSLPEFNSSGTGSVANTANAAYLSAPVLGLTTVSAVEGASPNTQTVTFFGKEAQMVLSAQWRG
jgi:hypothetical protein